MATLEQAAEIIVKDCMNIKKGESVLIITDKEKRTIADAFLEVVKKTADNYKLVEIPVGNQHGEEPSEDVAKEMLNYDVIIIPTSKSLSHTQARLNACKNKARIASMPMITEEILQRAIDIDYQELKKVHERLRKILIGSKEVKITTKAGTNVTTTVTEVHGEAAGLLHEPGDWGNLPTGEVDSGVKEEITNGIIIVDASFGGLGKLESPLKLEVKDGYVVSIEGKDAVGLKNMLDLVGKQAYKIAELGIGTNPKATVTGEVLEDEKALGTAHFGLGNDTNYGGCNDVQIHIDGVIKKPTIYIDDKMIMDNGKLVF